jgi:hypothetical protein
MIQFICHVDWDCLVILIRLNWKIDHESRLLSNRYECLKRRSSDVQLEIFWFRSSLFQLSLFAELLTRSRDSWHACESMSRKSARWALSRQSRLYRWSLWRSFVERFLCRRRDLRWSSDMFDAIQRDIASLRQLINELRRALLWW